MNPRDMARSYAGGRVAIGLLLFLFPRLVLKGTFGASPAISFLGRLVGARDVIIGAGTLAAMQDGGDLRRWMTYGAAADAADALATLVAYRHLPKVKRFGLLSMAFGGAATGGYLMTAVDAPTAE
jgi:hypothetical protein